MTWLPVRRPGRGAPVTIALQRAGSSRGPLFTVGLSGDCIEAIGWKKNDSVTLLRGGGDDAGKIRVVRNALPRLGRLMLHNGNGGAIRFGRIEFFGDDDREKVSVDHEMIDTNTMEITLPEDWAHDLPWNGVPKPPSVTVQKNATPPEEPEAAPDDAPAAAVEPAAEEADDAPETDAEPVFGNGKWSAPQPAKRPPSVSIGGIDIITLPGEEMVTHRGKSIEVTANQAAVTVQILREMPIALDRETLIKRIWGSRAPKNIWKVLAEIETELEKMLPEVGLALNRAKAGLSLKIGT